MNCFITAIALVVSIITYGQPGSRNQTSLSIGDFLPANVFTGLNPLGKKSPDSPGKFIIIDFFATWCSSCIKELPKLDSLQKEFGSRIQIVVVSKEPAEKVDDLRKRSKLFAAISLPVITSDSILHRLFPHKFIPHEVWIDPGGRVVAITDAHKITRTNINTFLTGQPLLLPVKKDNLKYNRNISLVLNESIPVKENTRYYALVTNNLRGLGSAIGRVTESGYVRYTYINLSIPKLYKQVFGLLPNRIVNQTGYSDSLNEPGISTEDWENKNLFCYEFTVPDSLTTDRRRSIMLNDLNRFLPAQGHLEKRKLKVWALVVLKDKPPVTSGAEPFSGLDSTGRCHFIINQPLSSIISIFNQAGMPIILNETGYTGHVDLHFPLNALNDTNTLKKHLQTQGFDLVSVERNIEFLIIHNRINKVADR